MWKFRWFGLCRFVKYGVPVSFVRKVEDHVLFPTVFPCVVGTFSGKSPHYESCTHTSVNVFPQHMLTAYGFFL